MTPTNQFKVHGQLPLHGMTVSAVCLYRTQTAVTSLSLLQNKATSNSWAAALSASSSTPTHTHSHTLFQDDYTCPSLSLPFHHPSLHLSLFVYFGPCCPRYCCSLMFFLCLCVLLPDQREWRWVGCAARLHVGWTAAVGGGGSKVRTVVVGAQTPCTWT